MLLLNTGMALPFMLNSLDNFHFTFCHKLEFFKRAQTSFMAHLSRDELG